MKSRFVNRYTYLIKRNIIFRKIAYILHHFQSISLPADFISLLTGSPPPLAVKPCHVLHTCSLPGRSLFNTASNLIYIYIFFFYNIYILKGDGASYEYAPTEVKLVVTFKGVFLVVNDVGQELLISANVKDVSYIWGDAEHDDEMVFITHQNNPSLIECHFIKVTSTLVVTAADDFVGTIDRAAQGKYPGSLGVWDVSYNGSVSVEEPKGNHVVKAANKRIAALGNEARAVALVVCETEIKVVDKDTAEEIKVFPIMDVSFTALDPKDSKKWSFITNDTQFALLYCHSFGISADDSQTIPRTISDSFAKVTAKFNAATPEERRAVQQSNKGTSGALGVFDAKYVFFFFCYVPPNNQVCCFCVSLMLLTAVAGSM